MTDVNKLKYWLQSQIAATEEYYKRNERLSSVALHRNELKTMKIALASLNNVCIWKYCDTEYNLDTGCGGKAQFTTGPLEDNRIIFCPMCGKPVVVLESEEDL